MRFDFCLAKSEQLIQQVKDVQATTTTVLYVFVSMTATKLVHFVLNVQHIGKRVSELCLELERVLLRKVNSAGNVADSADFVRICVGVLI